MNITGRPTASLATEIFDAETLALLEAIEVELPDFGNVDLDVAFGTPLEMYEAGPLPHERLDGLDITAAVAAIEARENRMLAARDITATDPTATELVRERLVDVLLPYATQLCIRRPAAAAALPLAA
ncbi:hypothetical protein GL263_03940 [Streptomyces durbertensis]|uniref:Uncharacterized protein n=1 Tax=Streptomyces durbertensis TaxID=2448886 RepID=A0ABR6EC36_9ACTN|nr:hypothetical protein [Streptomyces durbertensis]MBB1242728.1 hypothetical protein [Streptomyces durbertensis]